MDASILAPAGHTGPAFAIYANFDVIMRWNRSESYAISVGYLADRIAGAGGLIVEPDEDTPRLGRALVTDVQNELQRRGFDPNGVDGLFGSGTRAALRDFQQANGLVPDGFLDQRSLDLLLTN